MSVIIFLIVLMQIAMGTAAGPWDYQHVDAFDEVNLRYSSVNPSNCRNKARQDLYLSEETLSQLPRFNRLLTSVIYPNRTNLLHLHNMALNRAFFYSYVFQKLDKAAMFHQQPGLMYFYYSNAALVSANEYNINGSAVMFDRNTCYANFMLNLKFNTTLTRFVLPSYAAVACVHAACVGFCFTFTF